MTVPVTKRVGTPVRDRCPNPVRRSAPPEHSTRWRTFSTPTCLRVTVGRVISGQRPAPEGGSRIPERVNQAPVSASAAVTSTPTRRSARVHAATVTPVVTTSSSSTTRVPGGGQPPGKGRTRPARLATRCALLSPTASRAPRPSSRAGATAAGTPDSASRPAHWRARASTCGPPRARAAARLDGTGTNHHLPCSSGRAVATPGSASASARPSGRARSRLPRSLYASTSLRGIPS